MQGDLHALPMSFHELPNRPPAHRNVIVYGTLQRYQKTVINRFCPWTYRTFPSAQTPTWSKRKESLKPQTRQTRTSTLNPYHYLPGPPHTGTTKFMKFQLRCNARSTQVCPWTCRIFSKLLTTDWTMLRKSPETWTRQARRKIIPKAQQ